MLTLDKTGGAVAVAGNLTIGAAAAGLSSGVSMSASNQFGPNTVVTFSGGSGSGGFERFYMYGQSQTIGGIIDNSGGASNIDNARSYNGSSVLTFNLSATNNNFSGQIRDNQDGGGATIGLTVSGNGMLELSGNLIGYSGPTTVTTGTLWLHN